ncbi:TPA: DNA-packaging protein FI [Salmonella enterica subsp. enterica serovar Orion]
MATKEENIQRLRELATRLGRDPDVSGSAAELSQRVMEWEEEAEAEAEAEAEHLPAVENDSDESIVPPGIGQRSERVLIRALRTLHICAIDPDSTRELDMVMAGNPARISQHDVDELIAAGLIIEL